MNDIKKEQTPIRAGAGSRLDLESIRTKLAGKSGKKYWRSLEEVAETPEFQSWVEDEFPNRSTLGQIDRRTLLKFMGASMALAGLSGCRGYFLPQDKVVPYVRQPEELIPGKPMFYASSMILAGYATGVLVEQHEGRPTKIEGNPDHPASLGSVDSISQAEVLNFYDPDRSASVIQQGAVSTWEQFDAAMAEALAAQTATKGAGVRVLTGAVTSPTLTAQIEALLAKYPAARWHTYEPAGQSAAHEGAQIAFGRVLDTVYNFAPAKVVVSLDGDFMNPAETPGAFAYARKFMSGRRVTGKVAKMNRLYAFEAFPSIAGSVADHKWVLKPSEVAQVADALLQAVVGNGLTALPKAVPAEHFAAMVKDLTANPGASVVVAGKHQPAAVHALAHKINEALGNFGKTVTHIAPVETNLRPGVRGLTELTQELNAGTVDVLVVLDANPVFAAPSDLKFGEAFAKAKLKVHAGRYQDETALVSDWHLPLAHELEAWADARAFDGSLSIVQPLIMPLYDGKSSLEIVSRIAGKPAMGYDLVRETWRKNGFVGGDFEAAWQKAVHDGLLKGSASKPVTVKTTAVLPKVADPINGLEVAFRTDPTIFDGRYANNGWLQELPKPLTKITWDNAAILSPNTAKAKGIVDLDQVIKLTVNGVTVEATAFVLPGHPDDTITVHLGYGRTAGGTVATAYLDPNNPDARKWEEGGGFNAYALRTAANPWTGVVAEIAVLGGQLREIATTQGHSPLDDSRIKDERDIVRDFTADDFNEKIDEWLKEWEEKSKEINEGNMYPEEIFEWKGAQWGMTIDMNTCIGCNACVTACQSENNIPVVGKVQTKRNRAMHWIRIDRYYSGTDENPNVTWQPLMCVQCEKAPCEPVCPVAATVHSHEGLNMMVYNRCVGTRYCSNNCPYKVRKFNYLNWSDNQPNFETKSTLLGLGEKRVPGPIHSPKTNGRQLLSMISNPDVTVRGRGVMEKCTYCVQRINDARIEAKKAGKEVGDGDVLTACQQACPTNTIVFGNIADPNSEVAKLRKDPRAYLLLEELLTRPRTSHLAKLRNPNPEIKA